MLSRARPNAVELFDFNGKRKCDFPQSRIAGERGKKWESQTASTGNVMDMYRSNAINIGRKSCTHKNA
jgi:hypothetical protein